MKKNPQEQCFNCRHYSASDVYSSGGSVKVCALKHIIVRHNGTCEEWEGKTDGEI